MTGFTVLGAVRVIRDGRDIGLGSAPQRRLLGLLCSRANSVVASDRLTEQLGLSPGALRTSVSRLRAVVGADIVCTMPPGYLLRTDDVDARRFERLLADAATATSAEAAQHALQAALGLWRGDAYAEFAHESWAATEAARLESLRVGATEELCELALEARQWTNAIALIEPLIATEPFSDRPRGQLMRALAGSGRRASALRAFQDYRRFLVEETGTEPSAALVALDRLIATGPDQPPRPPSPEAQPEAIEYKSIEWSVRSLDEPDRTVLGRLSVFVAPFSCAAAEVVAGDDQVGMEAVLGSLGRLVDKRLLDLNAVTGRYHMHETIRQFFRSEPTQDGALEQARRAHASYYARWCTEVGLAERGIDRGPLQREMPDVVAAMAWARDHAPVEALRMCAGLASVRSVLGFYDNLYATWSWLVTFPRDGTLDAEWAEAAAALMAAAGGGAGIDVSPVGAEVDRLLPAGNRRARRWLARGRALPPAYRADLALLVAHAEEVVDGRDDLEISIYVGLCAYLLAQSGRLDEADRWLAEVQAMVRRHGAGFTADTVGNAFAARILVDLQRGRLSDCTAHATLPTPQAPGFAKTAATALGQVALCLHDPALLDRAARWSSRETLPTLQFLDRLMELYQSRFDGDVDDAADAAEHFWEQSKPVPVSRVFARPILNLVQLEAGRFADARRGTEEAVAVIGTMAAAPIHDAVLHQCQAQLASWTGAYDELTAEARFLLRIARRQGYALMAIDALELLAVGLDGAGHERRAERVMQVARTARGRTTYRIVMMAPHDRYDCLLARAVPAMHEPRRPDLDTALDLVRPS